MKPSLLLAFACFASTGLFAADASSGHGAGHGGSDSAKEDAKPSNYPLKTCIVSDEALGSMGKPFELIHKEDGKPDRRVLLCCSNCVDDFLKDPAKALAKLDAAEKAAGAPAHGSHSK